MHNPDISAYYIIYDNIYSSTILNLPRPNVLTNISYAKLTQKLMTS